jgi:hypothetical protein
LAILGSGTVLGKQVEIELEVGTRSPAMLIAATVS